eukprot:c2279_g1_i1.p1 GENE.c2279_g1_i1~~c2279_g1_i1.p1  ORF type:complete len:184 (+),score=29.02 c2279_g1_i1:42-593(+)
MQVAYPAKDPGGFIDTNTGNKISRKSFLSGSRNIRLGGKCFLDDGVVVRADLGDLKVGRYSIFLSGVVLRPSKDVKDSHFMYHSQSKIGDHVIIESNSILQSCNIGSFVHIGKNCVISRRCIINDCSQILDNSVLAPDTVVPPFHIFGGNPACHVGETPESMSEMMQDITVSYIRHLKPSPKS